MDKKWTKCIPNVRLTMSWTESGQNVFKCLSYHARDKKWTECIPNVRLTMSWTKSCILYSKCLSYHAMDKKWTNCIPNVCLTMPWTKSGQNVFQMSLIVLPWHGQKVDKSIPNDCLTMSWTESGQNVFKCLSYHARDKKWTKCFPNVRLTMLWTESGQNAFQIIVLPCRGQNIGRMYSKCLSYHVMDRKWAKCHGQKAGMFVLPCRGQKVGKMYSKCLSYHVMDRKWTNSIPNVCLTMSWTESWHVCLIMSWTESVQNVFRMVVLLCHGQKVGKMYFKWLSYHVMDRKWTNCIPNVCLTMPWTKSGKCIPNGCLTMPWTESGQNVFQMVVLPCHGQKVGKLYSKCLSYHIMDRNWAKSVLHKQVSLTAVNQSCLIHKAMNGCQNLNSLKGWLRKCKYYEIKRYCLSKLTRDI